VAKSAAPRPKKLTDYPRPSVAVDVAVLTVSDELLQVLAVEHRLGGRALPGTFLRENETLAGSAARALRQKANLSDVAFTQLHVFDALDRDERGWVLSVGHSAAIAADRIPADAILVPIVDGYPAAPLLFDHRDIAQRAVAALRLQYGQRLDPADLLGETFTVRQLRKIYEAVYGWPMMKDTFRRIVLPHLTATGELAGGFGRPAELFRKSPGSALPPSAWAAFSARA
jgi:ADP-ribose pyrophosphatase YjhB (NUDIX family)